MYCPILLSNSGEAEVGRQKSRPCTAHRASKHAHRWARNIASSEFGRRSWIVLSEELWNRYTSMGVMVGRRIGCRSKCKGNRKEPQGRLNPERNTWMRLCKRVRGHFSPACFCHISLHFFISFSPFLSWIILCFLILVFFVPGWNRRKSVRPQKSTPPLEWKITQVKQTRGLEITLHAAWVS